MEKNQLIELVTKAQNGDGAATDALFAAFYNDVYYFARKTVKDADLACDITQETFLEMIRTIGQLQEPAAFVTWMRKITYHQCTRYFKKKKDLLVDEDEDGNTIFDNLVDESADSVPSEVYEKEDFRNTILEIINELSEEQRAAVMLYYFDELSVGQIAQIQGVSEGTVKSRLNYARKSLKKSVEHYEKKHNVKLHSFAFLPLFLLYFGKEAMPAAKAAKVQATVSAAAEAVGTASAATAAGTAVVGGAGFAAKLAAIPLVTKLIAGVAAVAIAVGGGVLLARNGDDRTPAQTSVTAVSIATTTTTTEATTVNTTATTTEPPAVTGELHTDANADGFCEHCGEAMCALELADHLQETCVCVYCGVGEHVEGNVHPFCGNCSMRLPMDDQNGDGACDVCGEYSCGGTYHGFAHADENGDNRCDVCQQYMCAFVMELEHYVNYDDGIYDAKCDNCGNSIYAMGWGGDDRPHTDDDSDGVCDCCGEHLCAIHSMPEFGGVDADGDEICDLCGFFLCDGHDGQNNRNYHYDFDHDGKCDRCGHFICIHGYLPHTDANGDGICDNCYAIV